MLIECYDYILKKYRNDIKKINQKKLVFRSIELYNYALNKEKSKEIIENMKKNYNFNNIYYKLFNFYYNFIRKAK